MRERLRALAGKRVSREGVLVITAHRFRSLASRSGKMSRFLANAGLLAGEGVGRFGGAHTRLFGGGRKPVRHGFEFARQLA